MVGGRISLFLFPLFLDIHFQTTDAESHVRWDLGLIICLTTEPLVLIRLGKVLDPGALAGPVLCLTLRIAEHYSIGRVVDGSGGTGRGGILLSPGDFMIHVLGAPTTPPTA